MLVDQGPEGREMPTNRTRTKRKPKVRGELTSDEITHLLLGFCLDTHKPPFANETERVKAYRKNREYLFSLIGKGPQREFFGEIRWGKRPCGFWDYENSQGHYVEREHTEPLGQKVRGTFAIYGDSQFEYLKRYGLLLPGEEEQCREVFKSLVRDGAR